MHIARLKTVKVVTAVRDDVLGGTIREILTRVCPSADIELVTGQGPSIKDVRSEFDGQ